MKARGAAVWAALFAVYLVGPAVEDPRSEQVLRAARALWDGTPFDTDGVGIGLPLLLAPASGAGLAEPLLAALAALGFVAALALARRVAPEPYATGAVLAVGASAPAVAYGAAVYPDMVGGAALAGAVVLAVRVRENHRLAEALWSGVLLATLPWLAPKLVIAGAVVLAVQSLWLLRRGLSLAAVFSAEVVAVSVIVFLEVNATLYERALPAEDPTGAVGAAEHLARADRIPELALTFARAPALLLALVGAYALWRSRRERIARAIPARREAEALTALALATGLAVAAVATFLAPSVDAGWYGTRHVLSGFALAVVPVAWGLQRHPRAGALLGALSVAGGIAAAAGA